MKKNNLLFLVLCASVDLVARRDPFTCPLLQKTKKELSTPLPLKPEKKSAESHDQWQVHEMRKNTLVLKDAHGNVREISFSETKK